jgi:hypothetical protein
MDAVRRAGQAGGLPRNCALCHVAADSPVSAHDGRCAEHGRSARYGDGGGTRGAERQACGVCGSIAHAVRRLGAPLCTRAAGARNREAGRRACRVGARGQTETRRTARRQPARCLRSMRRSDEGASDRGAQAHASNVTAVGARSASPALRRSCGHARSGARLSVGLATMCPSVRCNAVQRRGPCGGRSSLTLQRPLEPRSG